MMSIGTNDMYDYSKINEVQIWKKKLNKSSSRLSYWCIHNNMETSEINNDIQYE